MRRLGFWFAEIHIILQPIAAGNADVADVVAGGEAVNLMDEEDNVDLH